MDQKINDINIDLPYSGMLENSKSFFYILKLDISDSLEAVIFWKTNLGRCYYLEAHAVATIKKEAVPFIIQHREIRTDKFDKFLESILLRNIMSLKLKINDDVMKNHHDYYYILLENGDFHKFQGGCGFDSDPRLGEILDITMNMKLDCLRNGKKIKFNK